MLSISSASAQATEWHNARSRISSARRSRSSGSSTLESASPRMGRAGLRITAAATTGPASGPRPASSTPATRSRTRSFMATIFMTLVMKIGAHRRALSRRRAARRSRSRRAPRRRAAVSRGWRRIRAAPAPPAPAVRTSLRAHQPGWLALACFLKKFRHQLGARQQVRLREVPHLHQSEPPQQKGGDRPEPVRHHHGTLAERGLERGGARRHQHHVGRGQRAARIAVEQAYRRARRQRGAALGEQVTQGRRHHRGDAHQSGITRGQQLRRAREGLGQPLHFGAPAAGQDREHARGRRNAERGARARRDRRPWVSGRPADDRRRSRARRTRDRNPARTETGRG